MLKLVYRLSMGFMSMKINKKSAFTLSEVMVTLTLIGFIATMTLSTIGSSVPQRARLAEFKTAYSKMEAAIRSITVEDGRMYNCYECPTKDEQELYGIHMGGECAATGNQCRDLRNLFVRAMGATRFCETSPIKDGCLPENYPKSPDESCFQDFESGTAYVLDNSMILFTNGTDSLRLFAVDVNGRKGPNKWGQDIFTFSLKANEVINVRGKDYVTSIGVYPPSSCLPKADGATRSSDELLKEAMNYTD